MNRLKHISAGGLLVLVVLFEFVAFAFLSLRNQSFDYAALLVGAVIAVALVLEYILIKTISEHFDRYLLVIADMLICIGLILQYRIEPEVAFKQLTWFGVGLMALLVCMLLMRHYDIFKKLVYPIMAVSLALLGVLLFIGKETGGATNWIIVAGVSLQPSEFVKVALVFVMANYFSRYTHLRHMIPAAVFGITAVVLLVLERDLGAAMLIAGTFLIVFYASTGNLKTTAGGLGAGMAGAVASYFMFDHVRARVAVWINPWATYYSSGFQIAQGLMAIASGGLWGLGLTMGSPKTIPAYHTDYIFAVICEEFGIIFGIGVIALYLAFIVRGLLISLNAPNKYLTVVAFGCTTLITLQSFIIIAGVIKLIPLTGITLPFVSYGGSSLIAVMMMLGILQGVAVQSGEHLEDAMQEAALCKQDEI